MKTHKDHYFHKAKKEGFVARSAYKLQEIDQKHHLLKKNQAVLDLGCAPGSWLQYASQKVGAGGKVVGIDLTAVAIPLPAHVHVLQQDIYEHQAEAQYAQHFDVILSDMAPKTTGIRTVDSQKSHHLCEQVLFLAGHYLKAEGNLLVKAFQGGNFEALRKAFQKQFQQVKICKPQSSRKESVEIFLLGKNFLQAPPKSNYG